MMNFIKSAFNLVSYTNFLPIMVCVTFSPQNHKKKKKIENLLCLFSKKNSC